MLLSQKNVEPNIVVSGIPARKIETIQEYYEKKRKINVILLKT